MLTAKAAVRPARGVDASTNIRVYNTLSKSKEPLEPVVPGKIGIYLCGPTVYKPSHIGHMVGPVIFDTVKRYLTHSGYEVTLVVNVTDIDDKLIQESQVRGIGVAELAEEMTADYMANLEAMGVDTIDHFPRATDNVDEIIRFISMLIDKGFAYPADGGDVYFDVARDREYGKLSHRSIDELQGEGGEMAGRKRSPADFALWKGAKPGEPAWDSPWGPGRPGWHIECSAMSHRYLGETFDMHGGGLDLVFPHHENEIAQSECCHGKPQARYWLHNGLMQAADEVGKVGGRTTRAAEATREGGDAAAAAATPAEGDQQAQEAGKLGKSKGASAFRELLARYPAETIRFFLLSSHYRRPIYYSEARIQEVGTSLETFYRYFKRYQRVTGESFYDLPAPAHRSEGLDDAGGDAVLAELIEHRHRFLEAMDDDFNTGGAIGDLFELVRKLNRLVDSGHLESPTAADPAARHALRTGTVMLRELAGLLGLFRQPVEAPSAVAGTLGGQLLDLLVELRNQARAARAFARADQIRDALTLWHVKLEDRPDGTAWTLEGAAAAQSGAEHLVDEAVRLLIGLRADARKAKDFATADRVRDALAGVGIRLEDRPDGTEWTLES